MTAAQAAGAGHAPGGAVIIRLPHKARVMDQALALVAAGQLKTGDMAVLWYLASSLDNQSGESVRRYATIAAGCGVNRSTAVRAIARLKAAGLVEIRERHFRDGRGKAATAFRLAGAKPERVGAAVHRGSVHQCTIKTLSRPSHIPSGGPALQNDVRAAAAERVDWMAELAWLHKHGKYAEKFGYKSDDLARSDLDNWRRAKGDQAIAKALWMARAKRLYGAPLLDFLEKTYPQRRRAVR